MAAVVTLFLVMDPLDNVPLFLSVLKTVEPRRRRIVVLFLIALRMIFPSQGTLLLLQSAASTTSWGLMLAVTIAWALTGVILLSSTFLHRVLGERGLIAMERLMGMLLVMVAVQMRLNGVKTSLRLA